MEHNKNAGNLVVRGMRAPGHHLGGEKQIAVLKNSEVGKPRRRLMHMKRKWAGRKGDTGTRGGGEGKETNVC